MSEKYEVGQIFETVETFTTSLKDFEIQTNSKFIVGNSSNLNSKWKSFTCERFGEPRAKVT